MGRVRPTYVVFRLRALLAFSHFDACGALLWCQKGEEHLGEENHDNEKYDYEPNQIFGNLKRQFISSKLINCSRHKPQTIRAATHLKNRENKGCQLHVYAFEIAQDSQPHEAGRDGTKDT